MHVSASHRIRHQTNKRKQKTNNERTENHKTDYDLQTQKTPITYLYLFTHQPEKNIKDTSPPSQFQYKIKTKPLNCLFINQNDH